MIVQFAGILLATQVFNNQTYTSAVSAQIDSSPISALFFVLYIVIISALLLFLIKRFKASSIIIIWERLIVLVTSFFVFYIVLSTTSYGIFGNSTKPLFIYIPTAIAGALALLLLYEKIRRPNFRNTAAIISSIGVGLLLGLGFGPIFALVVFFLLAIYDFIAVFITRHMIALANVAMQNNLALMVDVSEYAAVPRSSLSSSQLSAYRDAIKSKAINIPDDIKNAVKGSITIPASVALGTGDLAMPLMLSVSFYKLYLNFTLSMFIAIGGVFGLILTMLILKRFKRALPAIPPILFGILCSLLAYFLIFGTLAI
jgi:presenilin-like A22 family membrane protease